MSEGSGSRGPPHHCATHTASAPREVHPISATHAREVHPISATHTASAPTNACALASTHTCRHARRHTWQTLRRLSIISIVSIILIINHLGIRERPTDRQLPGWRQGQYTLTAHAPRLPPHAHAEAHPSTRAEGWTLQQRRRHHGTAQWRSLDQEVHLRLALSDRRARKGKQAAKRHRCTYTSVYTNTWAVIQTGCQR